VKPLLLADFQKELDFESISDLFHFGHLFGYKTLFKGINQLPEASCLVFCDGKITIQKYWDYPYDEYVYVKQKCSKKEVDLYTGEMQDALLTAL